MGRSIRRMIAALLLIMLVCFVFSCLTACSKEEENDKAVAANYQLVRQAIIDPETTDIESLPYNADDTPEDLSHQSFLVIFYRYEGDNEFQWELDNVLYGAEKGSKALTQAWTEDELSQIPVIVFAISYVQTERYRSINTGNEVNISAEGVKLLFYNTKTKTVFMKDEIEPHELPKDKDNSRDYTVSGYDIIKQIKTDMGLYVMPAWLILVLCVGLFFGVPLLIFRIIHAVQDAKLKKMTSE